MVVLLWVFTLFNLIAGLASLGHAARLLTAAERAHWRSKRLHLMAVFTSWSFPLAAILGVALAWMHFNAGRLDSVPIVLAPIAWLLVMGVLFAIVDFAEDGVLGNARK